MEQFKRVTLLNKDNSPRRDTKQNSIGNKVSTNVGHRVQNETHESTISIVHDCLRFWRVID